MSTEMSETEQALVNAEARELFSILRSAAESVIEEIGMGRAVELAAQIIEVTNEECATQPIQLPSAGVWKSLEW